MRDLNKYHEDYKSLQFEHYQVYFRKKFEKERILKYNIQSILEVGCGLHPIWKTAPELNKYVVVEPTYDFYKEAQLTLPANATLLHSTLEDSVEELSQFDFDMVLISSLMHELNDRDHFITKLKSVLTPKTIVHINVPNANSFHRLLAKEMGLVKCTHELSQTNKKMQQNCVFDMESLKNLFLSSNFLVTDSGSLFVKPFTHEQMARVMKENIISEQILDGLYKMTQYMPELGSELFIEVQLNKELL